MCDISQCYLKAVKTSFTAFFRWHDSCKLSYLNYLKLIGILKARTFNDLGVAGIVAAVLITREAAAAVGVEIVLCVLIYRKDTFRNWEKYDKVSDPVFNSKIGKE